jgi:hypothetical protein
VTSKSAPVSTISLRLVFSTLMSNKHYTYRDGFRCDCGSWFLDSPIELRREALIGPNCPECARFLATRVTAPCCRKCFKTFCGDRTTWFPACEDPSLKAARFLLPLVPPPQFAAVDGSLERYRTPSQYQSSGGATPL